MSVHRDLAPDRLRDLVSNSSELFARESGRKVLEYGWCFPVAVLTRPSIDSDALVREVKPQARRFLPPFTTIPVIVDLSDRKVHVSVDNKSVAAGVYSLARELVESALGTWLT